MRYSDSTQFSRHLVRVQPCHIELARCPLQSNNVPRICDRCEANEPTVVLLWAEQLLPTRDAFRHKSYGTPPYIHD